MALRRCSVTELAVLIVSPSPDRAVILQRNRMTRSGGDGPFRKGVPTTVQCPKLEGKRDIVPPHLSPLPQGEEIRENLCQAYVLVLSKAKIYPLFPGGVS